MGNWTEQEKKAAQAALDRTVREANLPQPKPAKGQASKIRAHKRFKRLFGE